MVLGCSFCIATRGELKEANPGCSPGKIFKNIFFSLFHKFLNLDIWFENFKQVSVIEENLLNQDELFIYLNCVVNNSWFACLVWTVIKTLLAHLKSGVSLSLDCNWCMILLYQLLRLGVFTDQILRIEHQSISDPWFCEL